MSNQSATSRKEHRLFRYRLWGHQVVSEIDLGEIERLETGSSIAATLPKLYCKLLSPRASRATSGQLILECPDGSGDVWLAFWKDRSNYIATFPGLCSFRIMPAKRRIECTPVAGTALSTITHLLLDQAIPRFLCLQNGCLVLHACGVVAGGQAVAILGSSGQGKSTLATYLATNGSSLLTDDCLVLQRDERAGQWLAEPGYASVRLWPDSSEALGIGDEALTEFAHYTDKRRTSNLVPMRHAIEKKALKACFVMAPPTGSGQPIIRPMPNSESFQAALEAVFRLDPDNTELNRREFEALTSLLASTRFYSLSYERDFSLLPAVQKAIMDVIRPTQAVSKESV